MKALPAVGAELTASDGAASDGFGRAVAIAGSLAVAGASADESSKGAGYLFSNISALAGSGTQSAKLTASDGAASDYLGYSAGVSWAGALLGAYGDDDKGADAGAAYFYRSYSIGSGTVTQNTKLLASDGAAGDQFGISASMSGTTGLVGASGDASGRGAAYVFRDVYSATQSSITQSVKLTAADGEASDAFGTAVSMSGNGALVGATGDDDKGANAGAAYFFRNLASVTGTVTQNLKLVANDGAAGDNFGVAVGLSDTTALVGASGDASGRGAAYVFRGLGTGSGTKTHTTKLTASDGAASDGLGVSVALSGSVGLVGATGDDDKGTNAGAAYVYLGLDASGSTATETVKLLASDGAASDAFGFSVGLDGDNFVIGARLGNGAVANSGSAYVGRVSAFTTLNGSLWQTAATDGLSFVSRTDWVAGGTTDGQTLILSGGDSASVVSAGKAVFIGQEAGADSNNLIVAGALTATTVNIGRPGDNTGNLLRFDSSATIAVGSIYLADDNLLVLAGDYSNISTLISRLGSGVLKAWNEGTGQWQGVTASNYSGLVQPRYLDGYTLVPTRAFANNLVALDAVVPGVMNAGGTASLFSEYAFGLTGPVDLTLSAANIGDSTSYNLLTVQRGARLTSQNAYVGQGADGDHNAVKITGARSQWTVHDQFRLGEQGSGATLSVTDGGVLKPSNFYVGYEAGSTGNLVTVTGAGSVIEGSNLWLGYGGGGNSFSVTAGGKVSGYNFTFGQLAGSDENSLTVDGAGSLFAPSSNFVVGKAGSDNTAVVSGGATLQSSVNMLGEATGAENNSVTVTGTGSLWTIANILTVGGEGSRNRVSVLAGGKVQGAVTYLGYQSGSSANTLTVSGAGSSYAASFGSIVVGYRGTDNSALVESQGVLSTSGSGVIGDQAGAVRNLVTITGAGSKWTTGNLYVGNYGADNRLEIVNGGQVVSTSAGYIGAQTGADRNSVLVSGAGSSWTTTNSLYVGQGGSSNSLRVEAGATVTGSGGAFVGGAAGTGGNTLTISGAGSSLSVGSSNSFMLGNSSAGNTLLVADGGQLSAHYSYLGGANPGSSGNRARVTGAGSRWSTTFGLFIEGGSSELLVADGGRVTSSNMIQLGTAASSTGSLLTVTGENSRLVSASMLNVGTATNGGNRLVLANAGVAALDGSILNVNVGLGNFIALAEGFFAWKGDHVAAFEAMIASGAFRYSLDDEWTSGGVANFDYGYFADEASALEFTGGRYGDLAGYTIITAEMVSTVPEPASWGMLLGGFGLAIALAGRRRRRAA